MTDVVFVIAYRDMGDPHRAAAFRYVCDYYLRLDCPVLVESGVSDAAFTRAGALNSMIAAVPGNPVVVQTDPDSLVPLDTLRHAIAMADACGGLVIPHDRYLYLAPAPTTAILTGGVGVDPFSAGPEHCESFGPNGSGNVTVFCRATWQAAGGYDERFGLWGGDDAAFAYACEALVGPARRLHGDMVHLWHPRLPQSVPGHPGYSAQFAILAAYRDAAATGPEAVRELVRNR
jgi:hypothetical protein